MTIHQVTTGDTANVPVHVIAGRAVDEFGNGSPIPVTNSGWVCRAQLLNSKRELVGQERIVTETFMIDGIPHFYAAITPEEADLMVNDFQRIKPAIYYWSAEIENLALNYRHSEEVELAVMKKP